MRYIHYRKSIKNKMTQKLIVSSDYDLTLVHGWMSEVLVQSLPPFTRFMDNELGHGCIYKCPQSDVYISFEPRYVFYYYTDAHQL